MRNDSFTGKAVVLFLLLVIILSAVIEAAYCMGGPEWLVAILMWTPALSAFIAAAASIHGNGEKLSFKALRTLLGIKICRLRYILAGVAIPFIYLFIPYRIYWTMHPENYAYSGVSLLLVLKDVGLYTVVCLLMSMLTAAGEEIGWRGFMLPALLERIGTAKSMATVSLFWCFWHFPLLIWGGYMEGTPLWYQLVSFVLCIFPVGIIAAILTMQSGSVWPAAFLHAAHNTYDQMLFGVITRGDDKMYYVSETGLLTILCVWLIAILMYNRFRKRRMDAALTGDDGRTK